MESQVPPGLESLLDGLNFTVVEEGGSGNWTEYSASKRFTNAFLVDEGANKILLGYKKRGFAQGIYNGFGGKVDPGETSIQAAHRELDEEAQVQAPLQHCGVLLFYQNGHEYAHEIDLYRAETWTGIPTETEEMKPRWFDIPPPTSDFIALAQQLKRDDGVEEETKVETMPLHRMWKDDMLWMPLFLSKRRFVGRVDLVDPKQGDTQKSLLHPLVKWWIAVLDS
ncbi:hypothetical protein FRC19_002882 [Serendipita sp. 401]|nr:hypothetical protein FRC19_002882 [Serendipita sp. 401]KAG9055136.1 hypothetical protein FS842_003069 [Serendipita sp. 407]